MAGMNMTENVEHLRQSLQMYDQNLAEHRDAVLLTSTQKTLLRSYIISFTQNQCLLSLLCISFFQQ